MMWRWDADRQRTDPDGGYASEYPTQVEKLALRVLDLLPLAGVERGRDVIQLTESVDDGLVIIVTAEAVELRLPTVEWTGGAHSPVLSSRSWKRVTATSITNEQLAALIDEARKARRAQYRTCRYCGRPTPPEHRHSNTVCHGCAEEHLGVVH